MNVSEVLVPARRVNLWFIAVVSKLVKVRCISPTSYLSTWYMNSQEDDNGKIINASVAELEVGHWVNHFTESRQVTGYILSFLSVGSCVKPSFVVGTRAGKKLGFGGKLLRLLSFF